MRRLGYFMAIVICLVMALTGCAKSTAETEFSSNAKLKIVTTTFPQYDFARQITGDKAEVTLLLSPGMETHSFEPSPKDRIDIANSDVFIYTGGEVWIDEVLDSMDAEGIELISLMAIVNLLEEEVVEGMVHEHDHGDHEDADEDHDHDHDAHEEAVEEHDHEAHSEHEEGIEYDEHVWTSPKNAIAIVQAISESVIELDPDNKSTYQTNTEAYIEKLEGLDQLFNSVTESAARKTIIVADRFPFRYLVDAYGLEYYAAFTGCCTQTDASPTTLAFLIDKARDENIPVVFYTEQSNQQMADAVCESAHCEKMLLHSCHNVSQEEKERGETYVTLMTQNAHNLMEALK